MHYSKCQISTRPNHKHICAGRINIASLKFYSTVKALEYIVGDQMEWLKMAGEVAQNMAALFYNTIEAKLTQWVLCNCELRITMQYRTMLYWMYIAFRFYRDHIDCTIVRRNILNCKSTCQCKRGNIPFLMSWDSTFPLISRPDNDICSCKGCLHLSHV